MRFHVGQKVVCVDDSPTPRGERILRINAVYVIRKIIVEPLDGEVGFALTGIILPIHPLFGIEHGWKSARFRPLEEMKEEARQRQQSQLPTHSPASK